MTSVLIDGRALGGDGVYRGSGRYLRGVLRHLAQCDDLQMKALVGDDALLPEGVTPIAVRRRAPGRYAHLEHDLLLPRDIKRHASDIFHAPAHDPPRRCDRPWVQTLHDAIPVILDEPTYAAGRRRWRRLGHRMQHAAAVLANSRHTAEEGVRVLGLDAARMHVALLGVDNQFEPPSDAAVRNGDPPYVLLVAEYGPNKGYARAVAVVDGLVQMGLPHRLRVVGRLAPWVRPTVDALRNAAAHPDRIELLGWVPDEELIRLYQGATALIVTSRAEGFCLPAAEAMASATPVVAFANSALTEVIAEGGKLVPDGDVDAFVAAVARLATDHRYFGEASERALLRSAAFDWASCAAVHADVYQMVAATA